MDIVEQMRSFESDHEPDGWPAVTMGQISALCDEIERLKSIIDEANAQEPCFEVGRHGKSGDYFVAELKSKVRLCKGMKLYASPIPAQPSPRITEQDFIEIIKSYMTVSIPFKVTFESWISAEGKDLLAKLNEAKHD